MSHLRGEGTDTSFRGGRHRKLVALLALSLAMPLILSGCSTGSTVTVNTLWFGSDADGKATEGVTQVDIATSQTDSDTYAIDLANTDAMADKEWQAATWSGATQAMLFLGMRPPGHSLSFDVPEKIGGPSAGGLLTAGSVSSLSGVPVREAVAMTGTILPNGRIGNVGGIPDKMRAAKAAGMSTILVPTGVTTALDRGTGDRRELRTYASDLGIQMIPVATVTDAVRELTGRDFRRPEQAPGDIPATILAPFASATEQLLPAMRSAATTLAPLTAGQEEGSIYDPNDFEADQVLLPKLRKQLAGIDQKIQALLTEKKPIEAFQLASRADIAARAWNARQQTRQSIKQQGLKATLEKTVATAEAAQAAIVAASSLRGWNPSQAEQAGAAVTALTIGARASFDLAFGVADTVKTDPIEEDSVVGLANSIVVALGDTQTVMPVFLAAAQAEGRVPIPQPEQLIASFASYAQLLAEASRANTRYYRDVLSGGDNAEAISQILAVVDRQFETLLARTDSQSPIDAALQDTAVSLQWYTLNSMLTADSSDNVDADPVGLIPRELAKSRAVADTAIRALAGSGMDTGFVQASVVWAAGMADPAVSGELTNELKAMTYLDVVEVGAQLVFVAADQPLGVPNGSS